MRLGGAGTWGIFAASVVLIDGPAAAQFAECSAAGVSDRFVEAARHCTPKTNARARRATVAPATAAPPPVSAVRSVAVVEHRDPVSIRVPGYRQRLNIATREVRARGGDRAPHALVTAVAHRYRINPRLLASIVHTESRGRYGAISHKGALGVMQVMPATARSMGVRNPRDMLTNPVLALSTGAAYLKHLQAQFGNDVPLVVAAYNAGPGAVRKAGRRIPRYRETQDYVRNVVGGYAGRAR